MPLMPNHCSDSVRGGRKLGEEQGTAQWRALGDMLQQLQSAEWQLASSKAFSL